MLRQLKMAIGYTGGPLAVAAGIFAFLQDRPGIGAILLVLGALLFTVGYFS